MGLFESGLFRQPQPGEFTRVDPLPEDLAEIFLKHAEFHASKYSIF
jgi:hypothetical protein